MNVRRILVCCLFALSGCAGLKEAMYHPSLSVTQGTPGSINVGAAKRLTIVQLGQARAALREKLVSELQKQGRAGGYFQVSDRSEEGIVVTVAGRTATTSTVPPQGEVFVRADIIESGADSVAKQLPVKDAQGNVVGQKTVTTYQGRALVGFTVANGKGKALAADTQLEGTAEAEQRDAAFDGAIKDVVTKFYTAVTPGRVSRQLAFDKADLAERPILDTAVGGAIPRATEEMRNYLAANSANPMAMFNMAVLLEAGGNYQEALDLYSKAAGAAPTKPEYNAAKTACATALANEQALLE